MRTRTFCLILSSVLLASAANAERYLWTLSASDTDPYANTSAPWVGFAEIHLWLACSTEGMSAAEFNVVSQTGNLLLLYWTPCCGFLFTEPGPCFPLLAVGGCPSGPARAGWFGVFDFTGQGGSLCIVPCDSSGLNRTATCGADPQWHPNAWIGFASDGTAPCSGGGCGPISVEGDSWGRVKSLYRR